VETYRGYAAALLAAAGWSTYTHYSRYRNSASPYLLGLGAGGACLVSLVVHLLTETTVSVSGFQWVMLAVSGVLVIGVSLFIWDYAVKFGNFRLLGKFAYTTPILSVILLVLFGKVAFNFILIAALGLILSGCYLSLVGSKKHKKAKDSSCVSQQ
jgi:drug/metabolite transporter (DMT)-like permease